MLALAKEIFRWAQISGKALLSPADIFHSFSPVTACFK
jgi:hypothetical protein